MRETKKLPDCSGSFLMNSLEQRFLCCLAHTELENGACWDLDGCASCWVAAHTCCAVLLYHLSKARECNFTSTLDFAVDQRDEAVVHFSSLFLGNSPTL